MNTSTSNTALDTLDKLNIVKEDISFISNLLIAWNLDQSAFTYQDLSSLSRVCDRVYNEIGVCEENVRGFVNKH